LGADYLGQQLYLFFGVLVRVSGVAYQLVGVYQFIKGTKNGNIACRRSRLCLGFIFCFAGGFRVWVRGLRHASFPFLLRI
jgi:hypothetical protein